MALAHVLKTTNIFHQFLETFLVCHPMQFPECWELVSFPVEAHVNYLHVLTMVLLSDIPDVIMVLVFEIGVSPSSLWLPLYFQPGTIFKFLAGFRVT